MSFNEPLCILVVYIQANQVPAKGIWFEVTIQDGKVDIKKGAKAAEGVKVHLFI